MDLNPSYPRHSPPAQFDLLLFCYLARSKRSRNTVPKPRIVKARSMEDERMIRRAQGHSAAILRMADLSFSIFPRFSSSPGLFPLRQGRILL